MSTIGYATLDIIPSLKGASAQISRQLAPSLTTAGKEAGLKAGRAAGSSMAHGMQQTGSKAGSNIFSNIEKGAAVSGVGAGRRFGTALHSTLGEYVKQIGSLAVGFFAFEKAKDIFHDMIEEGEEARKVGDLTAQVIKSTGGAAGVTAKQVADLAGSLSEKVGVDDEAIQSGENLLLTFKNVRNEAGKGNDVFNQATAAFVDMAAGMAAASGGAVDYRSAVTLVGKALNDPIKGLTALSRVGVTFTESQKDQIKALVATGHTMDAQRVILGELKSEFGGAAEALATPADKANVAWKNFEETIGTKLLPVLDKASIAGANSLNGIVAGASAIPGPLKEAGLAWAAFAAAQRLGIGSAVMSQYAAARGRVLGLGASLRSLAADASIAGRSMFVAGANTERAAASIGRTRSAMLGLGKGAAVLGGVALLASGASDKLGVTNTASLALAGSMAGPLGAAAGATVGAFLDVSQAGSRLDDSINQVAGTVPELVAKLESLRASASDLDQNKAGGGFFSSGFWNDWGRSVKSAFTGDWASKATFGIFGTTGYEKTEAGIKATAKRLDGLTGSARTAAAAQGGYGKAAQAAALASQAEARALAEGRNAAHDQAAAFVGLGKSLNDSKTSLQGWIKEMQQQARALTEFTHNAKTAADKGLRQGLIKALEEAGPAGAMRMAQLAGATKSEIAKANRAWASGQRAVKKYTDEVGGVPGAKATRLTVRDLASGAVARLKRQLDGLHDKKLTVTVALNGASHALAVQQQLAQLEQRASGGPINPRDLYLVGENGPELFVSDRAGRIVDNSTLARAGGPAVAGGYATAGPPGGTVAATAGASLAVAIRELNQAMKANTHELNKSGKAAPSKADTRRINAEQKRLQKRLDALTTFKGAVDEFNPSSALPTVDPKNPIYANIKGQLATFAAAVTKSGGTWTKALSTQAGKLTRNALALDTATRRQDDLNTTLETYKQSLTDLQSTMASFSSGVSSQFNNSPFGQSATNEDGSPADPLGAFRSVLETDTANAKAMTAALQQLTTEGVSTDLFSAIASSGDVAFAQALAASGAGGVSDANNLYSSRDSAVAEAAAYATQRVYGGQESALQEQIAKQTQLIDQNETTMASLAGSVKTLGQQIENIAQRIVVENHVSIDGNDLTLHVAKHNQTITKRTGKNPMRV